MANTKLAVDLRQVEEILQAAEKLRSSELLAEQAEEALTAADHGDESSQDGALNEAVRLESEARAAGTEALVTASRFGLEDPWPPGAGAIELGNAARERLDELLHEFSGDLEVEAQATLNDLESRLQALGV